MIYNRASADKSGQRVSVESQDQENQAWCAREGWEVVATVTDNDRSATRYATRDREGYRRIRDGLLAGSWGRVDLLVMWESSRGERTMDGHVELRSLCAQLGVKLAYRGQVLDMSDGDDRFRAGLDALVDEREAERARDRTLRSHRASVAARKPRGSLPYGYVRAYEPVSGRVVQQTPCPQTAPVVWGIVDDVLAGATLYSIAQRLNAAGVVTPQGRRAQRRGVVREVNGWTSSMIRNLLRKPSLAGIRTHNGEVVGEGTWEPLIPVDRWRAVQAVLADPDRVRHHGGRDAAWLLSGIAECGLCGAWLRPMRNNGRMTYACAGLTPTSPKGHVARTAGPLDVFVSAAVVTRLSQPHALSVWSANPDRDETERAHLAAQLTYVRAELADAENSVGVPGGITVAAFARIEARLCATIADLESRLVPREVPRVVAEVAGPDAPARWRTLPLDGRRQLIRLLCRVQVDRVTRRGARGFDPSSVLITWRGDA